MNKGEYLMVIAAEECAEIQENIAKAIRFGVGNHHPDKPETTNGYEILKEFHQLKAVIDMLIIGRHIPSISHEKADEIYRKKEAAVEQWYMYSKGIGTVDE